MSEELINKVLTDQILHEKQGFALYLRVKKQIFEKYQGFQNVNEADLIDEKTNFRIASITKQFIAFAVLTLVENGDLKLKSQLGEIFAGLPKYLQKIEVHQLLSHTSGIPDFEEKEIFSPNEFVSDNEAFEYLKTKKIGHFAPETQYRYSNSGYVLLGLVISKISKEPLDEFMNNLLRDLGMKNSLMNNWQDSVVENQAFGHTFKGGRMVIFDERWDSKTKGDGAIYSSISDLKKWLRILRSNDSRIKKMHERAELADEFKTKTNSGFGLELVKFAGKNLVYHCGETSGTNSIIGYIPEEDVEFIFLTNLDSVNTDIFAANIMQKFIKNWLN